MNLITKKLDYIHCWIQIFYFMGQCATLGFASIYLLDKGFTNTLIGTVLALSSIGSVLLQPVLASFLDKHKDISIHRLIYLAAIIVIALSVLLLVGKIPTTFVAVIFTCILIVFMTLQPLMNALTFVFQNQEIYLNFGLARGIGSGAYAVVSIILGFILEKVSPSLLPIVHIVCCVCLILCMQKFYPPHTIQPTKKEKQQEQRNLFQFIRRYKKFMFLLIGVVFVYYGHTSIIYFFIQVMENIGGTTSSMGNAVSLAAILEIPTLFLFKRIKRRISCGNLLRIAGISFFIKHTIIYFATNVIVIYLAQIFQMFALAVLIPATVYYVVEQIDAEDLMKGQALMTGAMTLGGVFASLIGGRCIDLFGVSTLLLIGSGVSLVGAIIIYFGVETEKK